MPAGSPYDRQLLREHLEGLVPRVRSVRLGLDGMHWTVTRLGDARPFCTTCAEPRGALLCQRDNDAQSTCIACVMAPALGHTTEREDS